MANRIKGITVEISGDTTKLEESLQKVNTAIKETKSQLRDTERLLKLDPGNTELLEQKQRLLGNAVGDTKEKLSALKDAAEQANSALAKGDISQEQYDALQREIIETEQRLQGLEQEYRNFGSIQAQQVAAAGEKMQELGGKISSIGTGMTAAVTVPLAAVGAAGAASFAEVDKTMTLANKTMGNTEEQAQMLSQAMKQAAANSTYGMNDAANANLNFARAGLDAEQAAAALAPAMNLAAGEGGDLDTVSAGLVATINGFHGSFEEAGHYADVFAAACNNSSLDVDSLSNSMSVAAPVFAAAGYTVEDTALYLGKMADAGIDANKAANSLKTGLSRLISPAKDGSTALSGLGLITGEVSNAFINADGDTVGLSQAVGTLKESLSGLTEVEKKQALQSIFGREQSEKWLEVIEASPEKYAELTKEGSKTYDTLTKGLDKLSIPTGKGAEALERLGLVTQATSSAFINADGSMKSSAEVLNILHNAFADLSESEQIAAASAIFGKNQMAPWLALINTAPGDVESLAESIAGCAGTTEEMADAMMSGFGGSLEKLKSSIDVLVTSIGEALAPTIQKVAEFIQGLVDKFNSLTPAQQELIVKIGLVVAAIGPLLIIVGKVISAVGTIMTLVPKIQGAISTVMGAGGVLMGGMKALWAVIAANPIVLIVAAIAAVVAAFAHFWSTSEAFRNFWINLWNTCITTIQNAWNAITGFLTGAWSNITTKARETWEGIKQGAQQGVSGMVVTIQNGFNQVISFITSLPSRAVQWGADFIGGIIRGIQNMMGSLVNTISNVASTIASFLHFSAPDVGPLADYETWMPDFMKGMAEGIEKGRGLVRAAIKNAAGDMVMNPSVAVQGSVAATPDNRQGSGGNSTITAMLAEYLPYLPKLAELKVVMDSGATVGELAPGMDRALGLRAHRNGRQ